jgi:hypothetical protein
MSKQTTNPKSLPTLTPKQYEALLKETLRRLGDLGAYYIRTEADGTIVIREWDEIVARCGGTVPNAMVRHQRPTSLRLGRVGQLLTQVLETLQAGQPLVIRTEDIASLCTSAVPIDQ